MVQIEMLKTFPVARKTGFAFFTDLMRWPEWSPFEVEGAERARFRKKGDELTVRYRPFRIPVHGTMVLDEVVDNELIVATMSFPGAPAVHARFTFHTAGTHAFVLEAAMGLEAGHWFERSLQWMTLLPVIVRRDLRKSLERAHALMAEGVVKKAA